MTRFDSPFGEVLAVADGMGGYCGGAQAAEYVVAALSEQLQAADPGEGLEEAIERSFAAINRELHERGRSGDPNLRGMGSTLVMAILADVDEGVSVRVAHVGDSRLYLWRDGALQLITRDHSVLEELVSLGISAEEGRRRPDWSHLTRAFGHTPSVRPDLGDAWLLTPGDRLLLSSDGLHGFVEDDAIGALLGGGKPPGEVAELLVQTALADGSDDNVTVQVIEAEANAASAPVLPSPAPAAPWLAFVGFVLLAGAGVAYWGADEGWLSVRSELVVGEQAVAGPGLPAAAAPAASPVQPEPVVPTPQPTEALAAEQAASAPEEQDKCDLTIICAFSCEPWKSETWWSEVEKLAPDRRLRSISSTLSSVLALPATITGDFLLDDDGSTFGRRVRAGIEDVLARHEMSHAAQTFEDQPCRVVLQLPAPFDP